MNNFDLIRYTVYFKDGTFISVMAESLEDAEHQAHERTESNKSVDVIIPDVSG
jgi:hypothetical protein